MSDGLLAGYLPEREVAAQRGIALRTLRLERQRAGGAPWVRVGRGVYYSVDAFREWLRANEQQPVRRTPKRQRELTPA
jgi:hypothetical protein